MFFYKEMRMRNVYIGFLLDYILFVLVTFVIYYGDQSKETVCFWRTFPRRGVGRGFCILGGVISEQSIVLFFFVACELVLRR